MLAFESVIGMFVFFSSLKDVDGALIRFSNNKLHGFRSLMLAMLTCLVFACSGSGNNGDSGQPAGQDEIHQFGDVWAMHYPSTIGGYAADHTYLVGLDEEGEQHEWTCFSTLSGGDELANTRGDGLADLTTVGFMADKSPCKWPISYYLRVGICHQCANRGLYYIHRTVTDARGYAFFVSLYGTYGNDDYDTYSMAKCLEAAPPWQGDEMDSPADTTKAYPGSRESDVQNREIELYEMYYGRSHNAEQKSVDAGQRQRRYLDALFRLEIFEHLGDDLPRSLVDRLQQVRNEYLDAKTDLDQWALQNRYSSAELVEEYQRLFEDLNQHYKSILTADQYKQLFNMDYDARLDLSSFLPP